MTTAQQMTTEDLAAAYESECKMAASLYAAGADTTEADERVDMLLAEMIRRGIA